MPLVVESAAIGRRHVVAVKLHFLEEVAAGLALLGDAGGIDLHRDKRLDDQAGAVGIRTPTGGVLPATRPRLVVDQPVHGLPGVAALTQPLEGDDRERSRVALLGTTCRL